MDSPRLAWIRKHKVRLCHSPHCEEGPFCAWLPDNEYTGDVAKPYVSPYDSGAIPTNPEACGYGETEDDALSDLARRNGLRLWNEEECRSSGAVLL